MNTSLDLTNCDKEKIHQITYTQGHGTFVAISPLDLKIHFASENLPAFFDQDESAQFYIGRKLTEVLSHDLARMIQERLRSGVVRSGHQGKFVYSSNIDIYLFQISKDLFGIEFEKIQAPETEYLSKEEALNLFISKMHACKTLEELSNEACRAVRYLSGMDRVMVYKFFSPHMYGEVIGEDKVAEAFSFMRHRFPATDIPKPARDLYLRNQVRFIYDSHEKQMDIYPRTANVDMSDSRLRGVSLVHIEYLKNMGVRGSFSIAIIVDQKLWGLISCHSSKPISVPHSIRTKCETISHTLAMGASMFEKMDQMTLELSFYNKLHHIFERLKVSQNPLDQLFREGTSVLELFKCHGMVLVSAEKIDFFGITPLPEDIKKLWGWLITKMEDEGKTFFVSESLAAERPEFSSMKDQVSGLIAMRLSEVSDRILILMRSEFMETIHWGGDPRKNIDARNYGGVINPRVSFETWTEVLKNNSTPWNRHEVAGIQSFKSLIFDSLVGKEELLQELSKKLKN
jgi:chemotaxis family two-component system sensor kinase Cph1